MSAKFLFRLLALLSVFNLNQALNSSASPDSTFIFTFGGINDEDFRDIAVLHDHTFIMAGTTNGYGQGSNSVYLVRTDSAANHIWSKTIGGSGIDIAYGVATFSDTTFLVAGMSSSWPAQGYDGMLACLDTSGNILWQKYYGGSDWDFIYDVNTLPDHTILLAGETYSFSNGGSDAWALALNSAGDTIWTKHFGGTGDDNFKCVDVFENEIYFSGTLDSTDSNGKDGLVVKTDFGGNTIWQKTFNALGNEIIYGTCGLPNGNFVIYGGSSPFGADNSELYAEAYDTSGVFISSLSSSHPEDEYITHMAAVHNGNVAITGQKNPSGFGEKTMYNALLESNLNYISSNQVGGGNDEEGYSVVRTPDNRLAFVGYTTSYGFGNSDALLVIASHDTVIDGLNSTYVFNFYHENLSPIGVFESNGASQVQLYPNPFSNLLTIKVHQSKIVHLIVLDVLSRVCFDQKTDQPEETIDLGSLPTGLYTIMLELANGESIPARVLKR